LRVAQQAAGLDYKATVHGFRSSFSTWANDADAASPDVIDMALAHKPGNNVERRYNRSQLLEQRGRLMQRWADYLNGVEAGRVVQLRAG